MQQTSVNLFHSKIAARGLRVPAWAKKKGFKSKTVYSALDGRFTGKRRDGKIVSKILDAVRKEIAA